MAPLIKTNAHLAHRRARRAMLRRSALDSSIFEGASGLLQHEPSPSSYPRGRGSARTKASASRRRKPIKNGVAIDRGAILQKMLR